MLDLRLALARHGPMLALRLAEELSVCLVPRLWYVLDNTEHYWVDPRALLAEDATDRVAPGEGAVREGAVCQGSAWEGAQHGALGHVEHPSPSLCAGETGAIEMRSLAQWERARLDFGLPALRLYWTGDCLHDSFLPKDVDAGVLQRFERLTHDLEKRLGYARSGGGAMLHLAGGAIESVALAAALCRYRPLVLTVAGKHGAQPRLCELLEAGGVRCGSIDAEASAPVRRQLLPALARSGAIELCWAGLEIVAVHVVAPNALLMPTADNQCLGVDDELPSQPQACDWSARGDAKRTDFAEEYASSSSAPENAWEDASAYWYRLP